VNLRTDFTACVFVSSCCCCRCWSYDCHAYV
jgi:hypothetical protein